MEFYCPKCDYKFEVDWETIWDIQECTHGYVGFHLNDTFISCDKCGEICSDDDESVKTIEDYAPKPTKSTKNLDDYELPF